MNKEKLVKGFLILFQLATCAVWLATVSTQHMSTGANIFGMFLASGCIGTAMWVWGASRP